MNMLYLDCSMGAAGDMLSAALYELLPDGNDFLERLNGIGLKDTVISAEKSEKCGIMGTRFSVKIHGREEHEHEHDNGHTHEHEHDNGHTHEHEHKHDHEHHHSKMSDIEEIIDSLDIAEDIKDDAKSVYGLIAEAESAAHGKPVTDIHFHEVGTLDAIADVVTVCMLLREIRADRIAVSPIAVGSGQVKCAHGILPVPAPATAYILKDVPIYSGSVKGELCTPTGAALIRYFASDFGEMPIMRVSRIGYGMGAKDFEAANCVRAMLGETGNSSEMFEICCNVDDMTGESLAYAAKKLMTVCNDVYTVPTGMKKSRPGVMIGALCTADKKEEVINMMFHHTSTIGVREHKTRRYTLDRLIKTVDTVFGKVRVKESSGYGVVRRKYEFADIERIADENGISIEEVLERIEDTRYTSNRRKLNGNKTKDNKA